jgi:hypothetical protein
MAKIALNHKMYSEAFAKRETFSKYLERLDPTPEGSKLDAFERQLKERGIFTRSIYDKGITASVMEDAFYRTEDNDVLFPEYIARTVREAVMQDTMLPALIGQYTTINSNSYKSFYVDDQPTKQSKKRITEASELPKCKLSSRTQEVKIYKFGRAIEASYETIRRMQIDMLALHVRRIGMQAAKDKVEEIITVIKDGDGNNNAAPILKLTDLDSAASAGTLTSKGFLAFLMEFEEFSCDTIVAAKDAFLQILLANLGSFTAADVLKLLAAGAGKGVSLSVPQFPDQALKLFWHKDVASLQVHGINKQYAIEQVSEAGSDIQEAARFILNQTQVLTVSENNGYSKMFKEATKTLNLNA